MDDRTEVSRAPRTNLFANKETGILSRVERVDSAFAHIVVLPNGRQLGSAWAMPLADYDATFALRMEPMAAGAGADLSDMRLPANAPDSWYDIAYEGVYDAAPEAPAESGEDEATRLRARLAELEGAGTGA